MGKFAEKRYNYLTGGGPTDTTGTGAMTGNAELTELATRPEQPFVDDLAAASDFQSNYGTQTSRAMAYDPSITANALAENAKAFDQATAQQVGEIDTLANEAQNGNMQSGAAADAAMQRANDVARASALGGRGDSALMIREAEFAQGAGNRRARQDARLAGIEETDARRALSADLEIAAGGLQDSAARSYGNAVGTASNLNTQGQVAKGGMIATTGTNIIDDSATRANIAAASGDLGGRGLDTRLDVGAATMDAYLQPRQIARGQAINSAQADYNESRANSTAVGTGVQTVGQGVASMPSASQPPTGPRPPYSQDPDVIQSDPRAKQNVEPLEKVHRYMFEYKPGEGHKTGQQVGVMADELEEDPVANSLVKRDDRGMRVVDTGGAAMMALANQAELARRIRDLEKASGRG